MKIVYFTDLLLFSIGGVSNSLINLSTLLKKKGHKISILAPKSPGQIRKKNVLKGVSLDFFPSLEVPWNPRLRIGPPLSPRIISKVTKENPDIIHFHTPFLIGANALLLGKSLKKPLVGTFHTYFMQPEYLETAGLKNRGKILTNFLWKYAAFFYNQCDAVIAPSEIVKKDLKKYGVRKPIYTIPSPINQKDCKFLSSEKIERLRKKLGLAPKVILYVGRLSREKKLDILLKSFAKVTKKINNVSLLIIGDGQIKSELEFLAKKLSIKDKVVFAGPVDQEPLLSEGYFQVSDVFVTTSGSETQGISIIEAMYFGLPLVGVAKKGALDMIKNVGLLSNYNDASGIAKNIISVLTDKDLHKKLSKNSQKMFSQKFDAEKIIKQIENLYKHLSKTG